MKSMEQLFAFKASTNRQNTEKEIEDNFYNSNAILITPVAISITCMISQRMIREIVEIMI